MMNQKILTSVATLMIVACGAAPSEEGDTADALGPGGGVPTIQKCGAGRVYFDGACRGFAFFKTKARAGTTMVSVSGSDVVKQCNPTCAASEVSLLEERSGEALLVRITDDANVTGPQLEGVYHDSGYRVVLEAQYTLLPTSDAYYYWTFQVFEPRRGAGIGSPWTMVRTEWHSENDLYGGDVIYCGSDIAEANAELGWSGECQVWNERASSGNVCEVFGAGYGAIFFGTCSVIAVGGAAILTQPETIVTSPAFGGLAGTGVTGCATMGTFVYLVVSSVCELGAELMTADGCSQLPGGVPGIVTVPGPTVEDTTVVGPDNTAHQGCTVSSDLTQWCYDTADGACNCTTISQCVHVDCPDGHEQDTGDC